MSSQNDNRPLSSEGAAYPWILEHLLAYPGSYEIPLRTMYTLNSATQGQSQQNQSLPSPTFAPPMAGNAFPTPQRAEEQNNMTTATAAAQLRANVMNHISQSPNQPSSLPPSFVTNFVVKCFPRELGEVDFPHALTALDYLKDFEVRRRREVVAALDRLGVERVDIGQRKLLGKKYPGVLRWVINIEDQERKVEALYTQVYLGVRRWTLVNEMSLKPFSKSSCVAMLNTVYPPPIPNTQFVPPTHQLTAQILLTQRDGFFRYITAVEKHGASVLRKLINQGQRPDESTGWPAVQETVDKYLQVAKGIMDQCLETISKESLPSPTVSSFSMSEAEEEKRRKVDSGISFTHSSNRGSLASNQTRPSTGSSANTHSRNGSTEKPLPPYPQEVLNKPAGSTLERIAREIRKIRSRGDIRDSAKARPVTADASIVDAEGAQPPTPTKDKKIRLRPSLKNIRSSSILKERDTNSPSSAPSSRQGSVVEDEAAPTFNVAEMKRKIMIWEAKQRKKDGGDRMEVDG